MMAAVTAIPVRLAMTAAHRLRGIVSAVTGHRAAGAHGLVLTLSERIVLVRLTYVPGWHLPGGGVKARETAEQAVLRELREEIGLQGWRSIEPLAAGEEPICQPGPVSIFLVKGAVYKPRWSLEVAEVREFDASALPSDVSPLAGRAVRRLGSAEGRS